MTDESASTVKGRYCLLAFLALSVTACEIHSRPDDVSGVDGAAANSSEVDVPAVIVDPDEQTRSELLAAVSGALNGRPVTLASDALTSSSLLTVERKSHENLEGRPATGRMLESPEQFRLVKSKSHCILIHLGSGKRMPLEHGKCTPE